MRKHHGLLLGLLVTGALFAAAPASATPVRLGLGADDWVDVTGEFNLTLAVGANLTRAFTVGGRFGALITSSPTVVGVPLDLDLRLAPRRTPIYAELLVGPWILFENDHFRDQAVRAHVAFGFGYRSRVVELGIEVGYLDPKPIFGLRVGFVL
jgi:hypothetical protein